MKEQLYTIPVTEAFQSDCECPLCFMKKQLEENAIEYTLGPSYMEDDVRAQTDKLGFCSTHLSKMYERKNLLGVAMILKTHIDKTTKDIEELQRKKTQSTSLFKRKSNTSEIKSYIDQLDNSCFICQRINDTFKRYIVTIFYLYQSESEFRNLFIASKGFCTSHYGLLYDSAPNHLSGQHLTSFLTDLNELYLTNVKRIQEDLEWLINKFDYRYVNEPWKNSRDAVPRTMIKTNGIILDFNER